MQEFGTLEAGLSDGRHACPDHPAWSKNIFLHVSPAGRGALAERVSWVVDRRLSDRREAFGAGRPHACGSIEVAGLDATALPAAVSRVAAALGDPEARVYSCHPTRDVPILRSLLEAGRCDCTIDVRAISECLEQESLDLYSLFPAGGRDCRDLVRLIASELVEDVCDDLGAGAYAGGGRDPAMAMWLGWQSLRARIDNIAGARSVASPGSQLSASRLGCHVRVGIASADEVDSLDGAAGDSPHETMTAWTLVAVRDPAAATTVHALGRLGGTGAPSLSPPLAAADRHKGFVRTRLGDTYRLFGPGEGRLRPELRAHLKRFLHEAGYEDVRG